MVQNNLARVTSRMRRLAPIIVISVRHSGPACPGEDRCKVELEGATRVSRRLLQLHELYEEPIRAAMGLLKGRSFVQNKQNLREGVRLVRSIDPDDVPDSGFSEDVLDQRIDLRKFIHTCVRAAGQIEKPAHRLIILGLLEFRSDNEIRLMVRQELHQGETDGAWYTLKSRALAAFEEVCKKVISREMYARICEVLDVLGKNPPPRES